MQNMKKMCCNPKIIIGALLVAVGLVFFTPLKGVLLPYLPFIIVLACPLFMCVPMLFMMKGKKMKSEKKYFVCPECGYQYEEERWAKQCEDWCKEHQSCNLEIIQHGTASK